MIWIHQFQDMPWKPDTA